MKAEVRSPEVRGGEDRVVLTAASVAALVGGQVIGDANAELDAIAPLDRAGPRELSFLAGERYASQFAETRAGVVLIIPDLASRESPVRARIVVDKPHEALLKVIPALYPQQQAASGVHAAAVFGRGVKLGANISIGAGAVLGDGCTIEDGAIIGARCVIGAGVRIGARSQLHPGVVAYPGSDIGERVILHAGAVIGSDGFGYVYDAAGSQHRKIPHIGRCIIGNDVEIGANTTIDRGSISDTVIGAGTKIDNLVHIAHNVRIGRLCLIMAHAGIAGSAEIEDGVVIAGQAGIGGHVTIGKKAQIAGQAGVFGDVPAGETWSGYPARPHRESLRAQGALFRLSRLIRPLERLLENAEKGTGR